MKRIFGNFLLILATVPFLCGTDCSNWANAEWVMYVENHSDKTVYFIVGFDVVPGSGYYPTTELPNDSTRLRSVGVNQRIPISYASFRDVKAKPDDLIAVFVLDPDTVRKYTWDQLREDENWLKRYIFTRTELGAHAAPSNPLIYP